MPPIPRISPATIFQKGNTALITGGAGGIGLAIAHHCRKNGMKTGIVDCNVEQLDAAKQALAYDKPEDVVTFEVDVSDGKQWAVLQSDVQRSLGRISLLVLNAGTTATGTWGDSDYFDKILGTNLHGIVNGLNTFVPVIKRQKGPSSIVITGSKQGITNPPGNAAYNASKAAVKSLAEHLNYDLKDTDTSVHLLVPGWTYTALTGASSTKEKPAGAWTAEQTADYLFEKMDKGSFYIICPDNDVTTDTDKKRMMWSVGDIVYDRQPLSRWRKEYDQESKDWMEENSF